MKEMIEISQAALDDLYNKMDRVGKSGMTEKEFSRMHNLQAAIMHHEESYGEGFSDFGQIMIDALNTYSENTDSDAILVSVTEEIIRNAIEIMCHNELKPKILHS